MMPLYPDWTDIALRLGLTVVAGFLIGLNRGEQGHPAGIRTVMLVALAAAVSMLQANLLLPVAGKNPSSFAVMDMMRLPLGILSGMGFIGAGAILRRGDAIKGLTTAATLWFVTVMGLCFGGGQLGLGAIATGLGLVVLIGLKQLEAGIKITHRATVRVLARHAALTELGVAHQFAAAGYEVREHRLGFEEEGALVHFSCSVHWLARPDDYTIPHDLLRKLAVEPGVLRVDWRH